MRLGTPLTTILALASYATFAQTAQPKPELLLFHPSGPPLSYDVATIKPVDPNAAVTLPSGVRQIIAQNLRRYIMNAYGAMYAAQVVGGPEWLEKESFNIKGKAPDEIEAAQQAMSNEQRLNQNRAMQQALLADRFHLKVHFETRVLPVYELVPGKDGLKITEVPPPPVHKPGDPPVSIGPKSPLPPGSSRTMMSSNGLHVFDASAIQMPMLARIISGDAGDRPVVDHTGFSGYFDVKALTWAPVGDAAASNAPEAASLTGAIEKDFGLKLIPAKDPIEVLVIDTIEHPTEN